MYEGPSLDVIWWLTMAAIAITIGAGIVMLVRRPASSKDSSDG